VQRHELKILEILAGPGITVLAEGQEGLVGLVEISVRAEGAEGAKGPVPVLEAWYVTRSRRGQGIGRSLLNYAERWATSQGYHELASCTPLHHSLAMHLHQRFGFREVGRTVHFVKPLSALEPPSE
jgi:aminoglycoside 6'-N-acetyltransferase I